ncbi:MAG TPA: two-component system response regulator RppA [Candidatus Caenarcaniphilales bacterium]
MPTISLGNTITGFTKPATGRDLQIKSSMRILLVDDEAELADPLGRVLRREGYEVDVAYDGESALRAVHEHRCQGSIYGLLILDWLLPKQTGLEICQQMRSQGDSTPVLFLTAKDTVDDRVQGLDAGADDYLVKPFELRELLARVRALLRRPLALEADPQMNLGQRLQIEDLELDLENQVAYQRGRVIELSEKESQLLEYMMRHAGQLLTHDEIYQHLWPTVDKPNSNVLAAQIRLLRRKLETVQEAPLIHTVYGKGYRFGAAQ